MVAAHVYHLTPCHSHSDTSFLIERLMLPAEAPQAYSFAVSSMIVLWQHVGDLWPLGGITKEKWPAGIGTRSR